MPVETAPLEKLIAVLKAPDAVSVSDIDPHTLAAGLEDLKNRMAHAEHSHLRVLSATRGTDDRIVTLENKVAAIEHDRNDMQKVVKTSTDLPIATGKRVDELEARVRSVEGAVGAAPYKAPKPIEPAKPEPAKPATPASPGIFGTPAKAPDPMPSHA